MKILRLLTSFVIITLLIFSLVLCFIQSRPGKIFIKTLINKRLSDLNIPIKIEKIDGQLPFKVNIEHMQLSLDQDWKCVIPDLSFKLSMLHILKKDLSFSFIECPKILLEQKKTQKPLKIASQPTTFNIEKIKLPFDFSIKKLEIKEIVLKNKEEEIHLPINLLARGKLKKNFQFLRFESYALGKKIIFKGDFNPFKNESSVKLKGDLSSIASLNTFAQNSLESIKGELNLDLIGPFSTWQDIIEKTSESDKPLELTTHLEGHYSHPTFLSALNGPFSSFARIHLFSDHSLAVLEGQFQNNFLKLTSSALVDANLKIDKGNLFFSCDNISPLFPDYLLDDIQGHIGGNLSYENEEINIGLSSSHLLLGTQSYHDIKGHVKGVFSDEHFAGKIELSSKDSSIPFVLNSDLNIFQNKVVKLENCSLNSPLGYFKLEADYDPISIDWQGHLKAEKIDLSYLSLLYPQYNLKGRGEISSKISYKSGELVTSFEAYLRDLVHRNMSLASLSCEGNLKKIKNNWTGHVSSESKECYFNKLFFENLVFYLENDQSQWSYHLKSLSGTTQNNSVDSSGYLDKNHGTLLFNIQTFEGTLKNIPFILESPVSIQITQDRFEISSTTFKCGHGSLNFLLQKTPLKLKTKFLINEFPLDIINCYEQLLPEPISLKGEGDLTVYDEQASGFLNLNLQQSDPYSLSDNTFASSLDIKLNNNNVDLEGRIDKKNAFTGSIKGMIPLNLSSFSTYFIDKEGFLDCLLDYQGQIDEWGHFIDLGSHKIQGFLKTKMHIIGSLDQPKIEGEGSLANGKYENYILGLSINKIEGSVTARDKEISINSLKGYDSQSGTIALNGIWLLDKNQNHPFKIKSILSHCQIANIENNTLKISGPLDFVGNFREASLTGDLEINQAHLFIPDNLPTDTPVIPIKFINKVVPLKKEKKDHPFHYPILFDINLKAGLTSPSPILLRGRGLRSEWGGKIQIKSEQEKTKIGGEISLVKGEFVFGGQVLSLTQGEIILNEHSLKETYLKVLGTLNQPGLTITALITGPIKNPSISFQSSPPIPTSSILSRMLFNRDINELSPFQAVQIAQLIVSLSGKMGPDVLETIRQGLGVDRLNLSNSKDGSDQIHVEIGKYLTKGVMITLSQGAQTTQILIEVDLSHGFKIQAETQPEQQGKISFKWEKNY